MRNFFSSPKAASRTRILRRTGAAGISVKGLLAGLHTKFREAKKCPFHRHFFNSVKIARADGAVRAMRAAHRARTSRRIVTASRATAACTRFVNAEAVFFILLV